jgi:formylglycine-generating enzyme required for sulfatase activity/CheY-like chemotaxis protein
LKILLVSHEAALLEQLRAELTQDPIRPDWVIDAAESAAAARDKIVASGGVDLLVTDVVMPEEDGLTLRESLHGSYPELRTIFVSEYDLSDYADRMVGCPLVSKPLEAGRLRGIVNQLFPAAAVVAKPVPVVSPKPVAGSVAAASPVRVAATPAPVVVGRPTAVAAPVAKAAAPTPASATPVAKPAVAKPAVAVSTPKPAAPSAAAPKTAPSIPQGPPEIELPPDALVGKTLGSYVIEAKVGETATGGIYRATQTSMSRSVRLYVLSNELCADPDAVKKFVANASAKANVKLPTMLTVYEAGQDQGVYFYSCEYFRAPTLQQLLDQGESLSEKAAFQILKTVSSGLADLAKNNILHQPLTPNGILFAGENKIRLANIAAIEPNATSTPPEDMKVLAAALAQALPPVSDGSVPGLRELLAKMQAGDPSLLKWAPLLSAVTAITPKVQVADAYKLDARERAAIKALEESKKKQKRSLLINGLVSLTLLTVALYVVYWAIFLRGSAYRNFDTMIRIPAGEFIYQDGEKVTLPEFWIDEHPVTIGQYSEFLQWLEKNPDKLATVAHPDAPSGKNYLPNDWADQNLNTGPMPGYFTRAKRWGKYKGAPLNLDSPVFGLDFYDAYAYAKWKGRRLPTEQEWEKAARGVSGNLFPWGNEPDDKKVNSGVDFDPNPEKGGHVDGWKRWAPVDAIKGDKSPFGVMGMAGNVSEWTDSWAESPELGGLKVPVIRGGNWQNPDYRLTRRLTVRMAEQNDMVLGFRTASDTAPSKDP